MTTPRIYLPRQMEKGELIELKEGDFRYIKNVLRLRSGAHIALFGYQGFEYGATIESIGPESVLARISESERIPGSDVRIVLAQSLPKGDKMDFIIQKATELGVSAVLPFHSARSIPRIAGEKARDRAARWRKIALEAARQCGRGDIPDVSEIGSYEQMLANKPDGGLNLIFWEAESGKGLKEVLRDPKNDPARDFFIIVGPEGGFSGEEVDRAVSAGITSVSLGRQVLKVETASLAIVSIIQYEKGLLGGAVT